MKEIYEKADKKIEVFGKERKQFFKVLAFIISFSSPFFFVAKNMDTDTWFLLNSGKYILEHGFTRIEPFSIYEGLAFSFQQWVTDVYFYLVYQLAGEEGLIVTIALESIIMLVLFYKLCVLVSEHNTGQSLLATILFSCFSSVVMVVRPQITTYIFLIAEVLVLENYVRSQKTKLLLILPLLSVLEINFHASTWGLLFVFLLPYLFELSRWERKRIQVDSYSKGPMWVVACVMFVCGILNPYGVTNILYLPNSTGSEYTSYVSEMSPATLISLSVFLIISISCVICIHYFNREGTIKLRYLFLYFGCAFMALVNQRNCVLFALAGFMICSYVFRKSSITGFKIVYFLLYLEIVVGTFVIAVKFEPANPGWQYQKESEEIIQYLKEICTPEETNLYTEYNTGAIYEFAGFRCSMDARMEVFLIKMNKVYNYFDEAVKAENGLMYYKDYLTKYDFDYYVMQKGRAICISVENDSDYEKLYETDNYILFGEKRR